MKPRLNLRVLSVLLAFITLSALFQNCSPVRTTSSNSTASTKNNGEPYSGKPYENGTGCAGTDPVRSRIHYIDASTAYLSKENCQAITPPRQLTPGAFNLDSNNSNVLYYSGLTFTASNPPGFSQKTEGMKNPADTSIPVSFSAPLTSGNLAVCFVAYRNEGPSVISVSDSAGNNYTRALAPVQGFGGNILQAEAWYAENVQGGAAVTISATFSAPIANAAIIQCNEFSNIAASGSLGSAVSSGSTTPVTTATIGPLNTSTVGNLIVAAVWTQAAGTGPVPGPGYSLISNYSADLYMYGVSGDPGPHTPTATNVGDYLGLALAFRTK